MHIAFWAWSDLMNFNYAFWSWQLPSNIYFYFRSTPEIITGKVLIDLVMKRDIG